jgi:hypothetical protein
MAKRKRMPTDLNQRAKAVVDFATSGEPGDEKVSAQLDCDVIEAFSRLKLRAAGMHQSLEATAGNLLDGSVRFDD